ncbi:hypothetical protein RJT34_25003 [Clitoria ternatea]|uniref:Uncharacterized protein n=1 Tax=Clitoria ternatea TaxID=43366 RepID=A0AAN9FNY7_CLITE
MQALWLPELFVRALANPPGGLFGLTEPGIGVDIFCHGMSTSRRRGYITVVQGLDGLRNPSFEQWFTAHMMHSRNDVFIFCLWWLWKWRCNLIFEEKAWEANFVILQIWTSMAEARRNRMVTDTLISWQPPEQPTVKINADALAAEIITIALACNLGYKDVICESDSLEAVELVAQTMDVSLFCRCYIWPILGKKIMLTTEQPPLCVVNMLCLDLLD